MGKLLLEHKLNRSVNLLKGYIDKLDEIIVGRGNSYVYHGLDAAARNYHTSFNTSHALLTKEGRPIADCFENLKYMSYNDLIITHAGIKKYSNRICHEDKKEKDLVKKLEILLEHSHVKDNKHILIQIIDVIKHIKSDIAHIREINKRFNSLIDHIRRQQEEIKHHKLSDDALDFILKQCNKADGIFNDILSIHREFKEKLSDIKSDELLNQSLFKKLDELLSNI